MTLFDDENMKCSVCGKTSQHPVLVSSSQFGYQDMDTRPSELYRYTMNTWLMECPYCGYVAGNIEDELAIDRDFLESDRYKRCDGIEFKSGLSKIFYKRYLIECEQSDDRGVYHALLYCAWTCDDGHDEENSELTRRLAVEAANKIIESADDDVDSYIVMKADLLRRIGDFDRVIEEYENLTLDDDLLNRIVRFQVEKAYWKDSKCYTLEEVS